MYNLEWKTFYNRSFSWKAFDMYRCLYEACLQIRHKKIKTELQNEIRKVRKSVHDFTLIGNSDNIIVNITLRKDNNNTIKDTDNT